MNLYAVVEGELASKKIYEYWIPYINPNLSYIDHISQIVSDNFSILMGGGQPGILERIDAAIVDVNAYGNIDRLIIALDSEDFTFEERYKWIYQHIAQMHCVAEIRIIIQHFCIHNRTEN